MLRTYDHEEKDYGKKRKLKGFTNPRASTYPITRPNGYRSAGNIGRLPAGDEPIYPPRTQPVGFGPASKLAIWQVARGATAAQSYFEPYQLGNTIYTDGAYGKDVNPTMVGVEEIEQRYGKDATNIVVSVGTAKSDLARKKNLKGLLKGYLHRSWDPEIVDRSMRKLEGDRNFKYFRVNEPEALKLELDDWKPRHRPWRSKEKVGSETIVQIEMIFGKWAKKPDIGILFDKCARNLVQIRRSRSKCNSRWEGFATGALYSCPLRGHCPGESKFSGRDELRDHLRHQHQLEGRRIADHGHSEDPLKEHKIKEWKYKHHELWEESG